MKHKKIRDYAIENANKKMCKFSLIIVLLIIFIYGLSVMREHDYTVIYSLVYVLPAVTIISIILYKIIAYEERIKYNILLENEEFYQSETGMIKVQPLDKNEENTELFDKKEFFAKQAEQHKIEVYMQNINDGTKYHKLKLVDVLNEGHLLLNYKVIN